MDSVNAKVNGLVNLVNSVNSGSKLIDAIGTQMHLSVGLLSPFPLTIANHRPSFFKAGGAGGALSALQKLASASVNEVAITELDIVNAVRLMLFPVLTTESLTTFSSIGPL